MDNNFENQENEKGNNRVIIGDNGLITGLFSNPKTVESAYDELLQKGYKNEDINLVMSEDTHSKYFSNVDSNVSTNLGNKSVEGLGIGAAIGGSVGALAAALAAAGTSLAIPPLGIIVSGALAAGLAGAGAGATAGGIVGFLLGLGIPNEQAKMLEGDIRKGGVIISVKTNSEQDLRDLNKKWLALQNSGFKSFAA
jgi:hypothetical protein